MPVQERIHRILLSCPHCDKPLYLSELCVCAEGKIYVTGVCFRCGTTIEWKATFAKLLRFAVEGDMEDAFNSTAP